MIEFVKKNKKRLCIVAVVIAVLIAVFWYGGNTPNSHGWRAKNDNKQQSSICESTLNEGNTDKEADNHESENVQPSKDTIGSATVANTDTPATSTKPSDMQPDSADDNSELRQNQASDTTNTTIVSGNNNVPPAGSSNSDSSIIKPTVTASSELSDNVNNLEAKLTCSISISCRTILSNMSSLREGKAPLVPSDGWILKAVEVEFKKGDSVFNVLQSVTRNYGIHMEYTKSPVYNSMYIKGIGNLYEFDCGDLSGWMYSVNGEFPNYGCSKYTIEDGDEIRLVYTCSQGSDVGAAVYSGN